MAIFYPLCFLLLFELIVLVSLYQQYKSAGFLYIRYAGLATAVEMASQVVIHMSLFLGQPTFLIVLASVLKQLFCVCILFAVANIVNKEAPTKISLFTFLLLAVVYLVKPEGSDTAWWVAAQIPAVLPLVFAVYWLIKIRKIGLLGVTWLTGLIAIHIHLKLVLPFLLVDPAFFGVVYYFNANVVVLIGVSFLIMATEGVMSASGAKDTQIQKYAREKQQLELQIYQTQKMESLGLMAAGIAHDFNNMLTSILGYASLAMKQLPTNSDVRKDLYMVMSGARQAVELTNQMLTYAGKGTLDYEAVNLTNIVDEMTTLMNSVTPKKIQLTIKTATDLPKLKGDRVQLGQVLMNLVANAVDAIEENVGEIIVATGLKEIDEALLKRSLTGSEPEPGEFIYLQVSDDGKGMQASQVGRIFDPFYSDKSSSKGMGLSSLSGIVRQHNGFVVVDSNLGEGSRFSVYFPVVSFQEITGAAKVSSPHIARSRKGRVLLADDDQRVRSLMSSLLESDRFTLVTAVNGKESLGLFERNEDAFEVLVLDCTMPKMSGIEVYREIRGRGFNVPVVLVSGYQQEQVNQEIADDSNAYFIMKPFDVDDFLSLVNQASEGTPGLII